MEDKDTKPYKWSRNLLVQYLCVGGSKYSLKKLSETTGRRKADIVALRETWALAKSLNIDVLKITDSFDKLGIEVKMELQIAKTLLDSKKIDMIKIFLYKAGPLRQLMKIKLENISDITESDIATRLEAIYEKFKL